MTTQPAPDEISTPNVSVTQDNEKNHHDVSTMMAKQSRILSSSSSSTLTTQTKSSEQHELICFTFLNFCEDKMTPCTFDRCAGKTTVLCLSNQHHDGKEMDLYCVCPDGSRIVPDDGDCANDDEDITTFMSIGSSSTSTTKQLPDSSSSWSLPNSENSATVATATTTSSSIAASTSESDVMLGTTTSVALPHPQEEAGSPGAAALFAINGNTAATAETASSSNDTISSSAIYFIAITALGLIFMSLVLAMHMPRRGDASRNNKQTADEDDQSNKNDAESILLRVDGERRGSSFLLEENNLNSSSSRCNSTNDQEFVDTDNPDFEFGHTRRTGWDGNKKKKTNIKGKTPFQVWKARILVICAAVLTGGNFVVVKVLNDSMPVGIHSVLRFGIGASFSFPWLFLNPMETGNKECVARGCESGIWDGVAYLSQALGLRTVPVAVSSFICAADIVLIPVLDRITGVPVVCRQWIGALLAIVGVWCLTVVGTSKDATGTAVKATDMILTLLQPIGFGVAFWRLGHAMDRFPGQAARLTAAQAQSIFVLSLGLGLWEVHGSSLGSYPWKEWFSDPNLVFCIVFAGVGTDLLANYLVNLSRDTLTSLESFLLYSTEQIWAVLIAWIVLGEVIGWGAVIGAALIMIGCLLVSEDLKLF